MRNRGGHLRGPPYSQYRQPQQASIVARAQPQWQQPTQRLQSC